MSNIGYMPRLDGLRALAIGAVLVDHFVHAAAIHSWRPGDGGVRLFFVLSGFLITGILLQERDRPAHAGDAAVRFFGRRVLRLSPALWLAIAATLALGLADMRRDWWKHGLYLTNFMVAERHDWSGAAHFWTLSVEEQFYLGWFFVVVLAPRRWLLPAIMACIVIGPAYRAMMAHRDADWPITLLPGQVDCLALGALLAWARSSDHAGRMVNRLGSPVLLAGAIAAAVLLCAPLGWPYPVSRAVQPLAIGVASVFAIASAAQPFAPGRGGPLDWPAVRHLGRISYGLYVYHYFIPQALDRALPGAANPPGVVPKLGTAAILTVATLAVAEASWWFIEKPILGLKRRLDTPGRTGPAPAVAADGQLPATAADSTPG